MSRQRAGGRFVNGGYIGPLEFSDTTTDVASNRHGLQLYGVGFIRFAPLFSQALKGDLVHVERRSLEGAEDPVITGDPWHVHGYKFEALTTWDTEGWTLHNNSYSQFFNANRIDAIWNVNGKKGAWKGPGSGNSAGLITAQGNEGWAIDWMPVDEDGSVQGNTIEYAELDGPQYGIRLNGVQSFRVGVRFVPRLNELINQTSKPDKLTAAWPKIGLKIGGISGPSGISTRNGDVNAYFYLRTSITDATKNTLGYFIDFSDDDNVQDIRINGTVSKTVSGYEVPASKYFAEYGSNNTYHNANSLNLDVSFNGKSYLRNVHHNALVARVGTAGNLPTTYSYANRLNFDSVELDEGPNWNETGKEYVVPATGKYDVAAQVMIDGTSGNLVKIGISLNGSLVGGAEMYRKSQGGVETFRVQRIGWRLTRGTRLSVIAAAPTASAYDGGASGSIVYTNFFEVVQV